MDDFTHLHVHSEFSFLDGFIRVWDDAAKKPGIFIKRLKDIGQKSIAITDHGSTAGWIRWHKACTKNEIVPIMGVEGYYCDDIKVRGLPEDLKIKAIRGLKSKKEQNAAVRLVEKKLGLAKRAHFTCWAMNEEGLYEILKSMSIAAIDGFYYRPRWDFNMIKNMKNCLFGTACPGGILNYYLNYEVEVLGKKADKEVFTTAGEKAVRELEKWKKELGDRLYVEIQALDWNRVQAYTLFSLMTANKLNIPVYMSNDCHYVNREDNETHDILLALGAAYKSTNKDVLNDPNRLRYDMKDLFIKSRKEMFDSFRKWHKRADIYSNEKINSWLDRSVEIGERCHHGINKKTMIMPKLVLPDFPRPNRSKDEQKDYLLYLVNEGWKKKIVPYVKKENWPKYKEQLQYELKEIMRQGFTPYFILVNQLMKWVDEQGIARGPARGSSAGSLVAYLCDITMVDPIPHKLLFSRFIDPNRSDFPDVDMDFEDWRRREIITYFVEKYGIDNVAALGNNMSYKPRFALKDVARLYGVPLWETNKLTNLVIERSGADSRLSFCLADTFKQFEFAKEYAKKYPQVARHAVALESRLARCISGDTLIHTKKGHKVTIRELFKTKCWIRGRGLCVKVFDSEKYFNFRFVKNIFFNGYERVFEIKTENYRLKCTADHKILTKNGYKALKDITREDYIGCNGLWVENKIPWPCKGWTNKGSFAKGFTPWNKGLKGSQVAWNKGLDKYTSESVAKQAIKMVGNTNGRFSKLGDKSLFRGHKKWGFRRRAIYVFGNKCMVKGCNNTDIDAHHIVKPKSGIVDHSSDNALILCKYHHRRLHVENGDMRWMKGRIGPMRLCVKWEKVKTIQKRGITDVYDIEVNTDKKFEHNYVANGIIVHNCGTHAAGIVIADGDIRKYSSLRRDNRNPDLLVSTIDKFDAESIGLLKMDVLGLNTMAVIQETKRLIKRNYNIDVDLEEMCRDVTYNGGDKSVYAEFAAGHTTGVFQFTTPGLTRLAMQVKIEKFSEISDCTALHRPSGIHCVSLMVKILRKVLVKCQEEWIEIEEWIKIGEVIGQICKIVVYDSKECMCCPKIGMVHKTGKQKVYKVKTKNGKELVCTEDERFNVGNGEYKKLKDIAIGESIYYI